MSKTLVDMPKVTQMLDSGWYVSLHKNDLGSYTAVGFHMNGRVRDKLAKIDGILDDDGSEEVTTDDFTPEQSLTRLAYKVHGEVI